MNDERANGSEEMEEAQSPASVARPDETSSAEAPEAPDSGVEPQASISVTYSNNQLRRARQLLTRMYAARRTARFYPIDHSATIEAIRGLRDVIRKYHAEGVDIALAFFEGELLLGEQLLPEESIIFDQLIREFTGMGVGSITIRRGVDNAELSRMISLLAADSYEIEHVGGIQRMSGEANMPHVEIGEVKVFERSETTENPEKAQGSYQDSLELMREIDTLIRRKKTVSPVRVRGVMRSMVDNVLSNRQAMLALTGLKSYDEYTFYHSANVALLSLALGSMITQDYRFLSTLGTGALLHDIGKMTVDFEILNKRGALSAEEWARVREHPVYGAEQAVVVSGLDRFAIVIILEHHMRYDGSGYPQSPSPRRQHLTSRIVAVADAYDAMTSQRSYSAARAPEEAMSILTQSAGTALDPVLTRMFVTMLGVYPPRTAVKLSDESTAVVVSPTEGDILRPLVRVIADSEGTLIDPTDVDLSVQDELKISRSLDTATLNIDVDDFL